MPKTNHGESRDSMADERRHAGFQKPNPMDMTAFEQEMSRKERMERTAAKVKYVLGIQGTDGGKCVEVSY